MEKEDGLQQPEGEMALEVSETPEAPEAAEALEASAASEAAAAPDLVVITGMSGAGRTEAMHTFEDIGYFCIDNLPPGLLGNLVSLAGIASEHPRKLAVVCDLRSAGLSGELADELSRLGDYGLSYCVVFLDSTDTALLNRYKANRRRHPLAGPGVSIADGIARERALMREVKHAADYVIDTSAKRPQQTRELEESGLARLAKAAYALLGLQSFFTAGEMEVKAWTIPVGCKAPQAAGTIHTDFERGFIKAETCSFDDFVAYGGEAGCREKGRLRQEGKEYVVCDGDVMHFKFNV